MTYPSFEEIKRAIIQMLTELGGEAQVNTVIEEVTGKFPQLTSDDLTRKDLSGVLSWHHRLHSVRVSMVRKDKSLDENAPRGIWRLKGVSPPPSIPAPAPIPPPPPSENQLEILLREHVQNIRSELINRLLNLSPSSFEKLSGQLLEALGFMNVQVTGRSGDGGIDGNGNLQLGIVTINAAFQVKRWQQNVPRDRIDAFKGAIQGNYDQGIFITTSDFTEDAKQVSTRPGTVPIILINGQKLIDIMIGKNIGVVSHPLTITRIDEEFLSSI